ncbi:TetR family transcriptional regulator [Streptomyces acidiscabies]|uniref:Uncharacterized protein n=1 Tax=Streptomyces acidiscabies TaxID=42234 RepID=A0AAP6BM65_9ACTN|nr:TetR family transcriptional regulator [Streptomyces acidiscabies]MDX2967103.1 hypothetical protein [Streptomyces acidiscabies]
MAANGLARTASLAEALGVTEVVESHLPREHGDGRGSGCTVAALGGDTARQPDDIKAQFTAGIESLATALQAGGDALPDADRRTARATVINVLAHSVGAIVLSRACSHGSPSADEVLDVCRGAILASLGHGDGGRPAAEES